MNEIFKFNMMSYFITNNYNKGGMQYGEKDFEKNKYPLKSFPDFDKSFLISDEFVNKDAEFKSSIEIMKNI
ncbi:MAG: hypothetical protein Q3M30_09245 [Candidatus Electrothrix sp. Rat3]|nr:hypothetical protein [Candidatus Electrothrix rattekaaiensis]